MTQEDDAFPARPQPSPNGQHPDAPVDGFNEWLDALVTGGKNGHIASAPTSHEAPIGETARRLHLMATRVDRHGASEATMERTWEAIMTETLDLHAAGTAKAAPDVLPAPERGMTERTRERHGLTPSRPSFMPEPRGPRLWQFVRRWQPAVSTAATLVLLFALIAGYAASRGVLPPGGDGDGWRQLAAVGTLVVQASPSPASVACTVEPLRVEEILRIDRLPPEFSPRSYTPVGKANAETAAAALAVVQERRVCEDVSSFHAYALGTDRYVWETSSTYWRERVNASPVPGETRYDLVGMTGNEEGMERIAVSMDRVIAEFMLQNGEVRPEITELAWWSTPQDDQAFLDGYFQSEDVFVLADGRVAALWADLEIPHGSVENVYNLPIGFYKFAAFAQVEGQWRLDEEAMFAISM